MRREWAVGIVRRPADGDMRAHAGLEIRRDVARRVAVQHAAMQAFDVRQFGVGRTLRRLPDGQPFQHAEHVEGVFNVLAR